MVQPFDDTTRRNIAERCAAFARLPEDEPAPTLKRAAVAIALVEANDAPDGTALLLTLRAAGLRAHRGQWALPGGRCDEGETPVMAALRELAEELGYGRPSLRANGSRECAPDDRLREAIHSYEIAPRGLLRRFAPRNDEKVAEAGAFDDDAAR